MKFYHVTHKKNLKNTLKYGLRRHNKRYDPGIMKPFTIKAVYVTNKNGLKSIVHFWKKNEDICIIELEHIEKLLSGPFTFVSGKYRGKYVERKEWLSLYEDISPQYIVDSYCL